MFKQLFLGAFMLLAIPGFAQESSLPAGIAETKAVSETARQLTMANQLVRYGYQTKSALPLIQAVQIYKSLNVTDGNLEMITEGGAANSPSMTKTDAISFDENKMLEDATRFAEGNKTLQTLINDAKKSTRRPMGGPIRETGTIEALATCQWDVSCYGGRVTSVNLSGEGDTDLDLYVYDAYGRLVDSDVKGLKDSLVSFIPTYNATFRIVVKNTGRKHNNFVLFIH